MVLLQMNSSLRFYTVLLKKLHLILSKLGKFRGGGVFWPTLYYIFIFVDTAGRQTDKCTTQIITI